MLYTIIKSPIFKPNLLIGLMTGYRSTINLDSDSITQSLSEYKAIYLTESLEKAQEIADSFYRNDGFPKVSGSFGLIIQVQLNLSDIPEKQTFDPSEFYNEWVKQQPANYHQQHSDERITGYKVLPKEIAKIQAVIVPNQVSVKYPALQSQDFEQYQSKCTIM